MKKIISLVLAAVMLMTVASFAVAAADYTQPFDFGRGEECENKFRIPSLYTLNDGSVLAIADARYGHGSDSPNNIDILAAISEDGYTGWEYFSLNHFDDYADGVTEANSASFIDCATVQSSTGRIFVVTDAQPAGCGYLQCKQGSGYITVDGKKCMLLTAGDNTNMNNMEYYIGADNVVFNRVEKTPTEYTVDAEYNLYKNGVALKMAQKGSEGVTVNQNVFYADAELRCFSSTFLWMRYSDDNGKTWSEPVILTEQIKTDNEFFLGICPGRGFVTTLEDGTERIIFMVYDNGIFGWNEFENVSTIYSDDNGVTWNRGAETIPSPLVGKTSESQIIDLGNGTLRMFARNKGTHVAYADSTDGGITWSDFVTDSALTAMGNCMVSFINTSKTINGKSVVLGAFPSNPDKRAGGVIKVGLINGTNPINWISTYKLTSTNDFFAYSCITELSDGNFGILYEDEAAHVQYLIFSVDENGNISEVNAADPEIKEEEVKLTGWQKFVKFFKDLLYKIAKFFGME